MLLICHVCRGTLDGQLNDHKEDFVCSKCEHIADRVFDLEERINNAEFRAQCIQRDVLDVLREHHADFSDKDTKKIAVKTKLLKDLWEAAQCRHFDSTTPKQFCDEFGMMLSIVRAAKRLFESGEKHMWNSPIDKMAKLYFAILSYYNFKSWPADLAYDHHAALEQLKNNKKKSWLWWRNRD